MRIHVVGSLPPFQDVRDLLVASVRTLGHECSAGDDFRRDALNIVLAYHLTGSIPAGTRYVLYQLEQIPSTQDRCLPVLQRLAPGALAVWDYDRANVDYLARHGIEARLAPIGYHEALERIEPRAKDIDVLFYGWLNDRRRTILKQIGRDCRLKVLKDVYGPERDEWIARSKIVLNIHYHTARIMEQVRVSYLLNNSAFVLSEDSASHPYGKGIATAAYSDIPEACRDWFAADEWRDEVAETGYQTMRGMPMPDVLGPLLRGLDAD